MPGFRSTVDKVCVPWHFPPRKLIVARQIAPIISEACKWNKICGFRKMLLIYNLKGGQVKM